MPLGTISSQGSSGENIIHIAGLRIRVTGNGNLKMKLYSMDNIISQSLVDMKMVAASNIQPIRLANFMQQRTYLEVKTTGLNETFRINRIILFAKSVFTMHPA